MRIFLAIALLYSTASFSQEKKLEAHQVSNAPKLDGSLDEQVWKELPEASDFICHQPDFGKPSKHRTTVKVIYDNNAVYIGARLYDETGNIRKQLTARDKHRQADVDNFAVFFDTYRDKQNGFEFLVTSRNVQSDARLSPNFQADFGEFGDLSWDAVWDSRVAVDKEGWTVEIKIPFSAIRFPKESVQNWGIQFMRFSRSHNEQSFWNPVDPAINGFVNQFGLLGGLRDLEPPLRLSFSPYLSTGYRINPADDKGDRSKEWLKSGGMDLKWGVNESFTLDATLIPDFGQVVSDNKVNNLSPFDIQFQENRPFFTEGTELFNKANIFYSRRVGGTPSKYDDVNAFAEENPNYSIERNPSVTPLFNALKFSGRNKHNLGIGIFNALTRPVDATLRNRTTGQDSVIRTEELANYNIIVFDKALRNRSFVSFTNTNVLRSGTKPDANVSALDVSLYSANNVYGFGVAPRFSQIIGTGGYNGWANSTSVGKVSGKWQWNFNNEILSDRYNPNDLGFLRTANLVTTKANLSYLVFKPTGKFLQQRYQLNAVQTFLYKPFKYQGIEIKASSFWWFRNFWDMTVSLVLNPVWYNDYFELRSNYKNLKRPSWFYLGVNGSSDSRKKLYVRVNAGFAETKDIYNDLFYQYELGLRYRFSDRLSVELENFMQNDHGQFGYAFEREPNGDPILALRSNISVATTLSGIYNFNSRMNMTFRGRHYWNKVRNFEFFDVDAEGYWHSRPFIEGKDLNVNIFNLDVFYVWDFRPGSRVVAGWKNWIDPEFNNDLKMLPGYKDNMQHLFNLSHGNEFSIRFIYYLDYQDLKKKRT